MIRKRGWAAIAGLLLLGAIVKPAPLVPRLLNEVLEARAGDVSFVGFPVGEAEPELVWQLSSLGSGNRWVLRTSLVWVPLKETRPEYDRRRS